MKKIFMTLAVAAIAASLPSCGGSTEKKEAPANNAATTTTTTTTTTTAATTTPATADATKEVAATQPQEEEEKPVSIQPEDVILPSSLKGKVKVVNGEDDCIPVVLSEYDSPEITITFELLERVNTTPLASSYGQLWIVGLAQDKAGRTIKDIMPSYDEWRTEDSDGEYFKAFLESEPGETITLTFTGSNGLAWNEKDEDKIDAAMEKTEQAMAKVGKFKLRITN